MERSCSTLINMSRKFREESETGFYHVMQRGVGKQIIFEESSDCARYMDKLAESRDRYNVTLGAFCLMNNHTHLLIRAESVGDLSRLMSSIGTSYASYYNLKYAHAGHVFQNRFRSEAINDDEYLLTCIRYIHDNPVKAGVAAREDYIWSSYRDYMTGHGITDVATMLKIFAKSDILDSADKGTSVIPMDCEMPNDKMAQGQNIINRVMGYEFDNGFIVKRLVKEERDEVIRRLKQEGFMNKEIELLTGVSQRIAQRVTKNKK